MTDAVIRTEGPLCSAHTGWPWDQGECAHETCWHVMFPLYIVEGMAPGWGARFVGTRA